MPKKVRLFLANFNDAYKSWIDTLPASSREDFIRMYAHTPHINLHQSSIKYLGYYEVEVGADNYEPNFKIPAKGLYFTQDKLGYEYLNAYFAEFGNIVRRYQEEDYKNNGY